MQAKHFCLILPGPNSTGSTPSSTKNLQSMARFFICTAITLIATCMGYAQKIEMIKTFGGVRFESDTVVYSPKQVLELMRDNPLAYEEFKKAKTNYGVAGALGAIGGFMVGFPLGTAIAGGEPEWGLAAGGAA
jgi:hypothetical protein